MLRWEKPLQEIAPVKSDKIMNLVLNSNNNDNDNDNNNNDNTTQSKPMYENNHLTAFWDVPVYADQTEVRATSQDARIVDRERRS